MILLFFINRRLSNDETNLVSMFYNYDEHIVKYLNTGVNQYVNSIR